MTATRPSGWVQSGDRWDLWWNGRSVAIIVPHAVLGFRLLLDVRKSPQPKVVAAANARQAKRYAERWCAARLCPQLRLRDAVARLVDAVTPLPMTSTRQQARRLAEAGSHEMGRIKEALASRPSVMLTKAEVPGRGGAWPIPGSVNPTPGWEGVPGRGYAESSSRTIFAPALSACSLPRATSRASGAMPQLVLG